MPRPRLTLGGSDCRPRRLRKPRELRPHAPLFKALGDETRLEIVALLARADDDGLCVCEIEARFDLAQSTISHHLKLLHKAGAVTSERRGTWIYYALDPRLGDRVRQFLTALE